MAPREEAGLHDAARAGDVAAIQSLLAVKPECVHNRDGHSRTPLHLAAWAGHAEAVRVLCEAQADVAAPAVDDMTAVHFACQKGHTEVARILLAAGAQINGRTRKGMTPLHYAVQGRHAEAAKLLIMKGANLTAQNKSGKRPADLCQDENFLALVKAAAEERKDLEAKRKEQKAAQSVANKAKFAAAAAAHAEEEEVVHVPGSVIGPTLSESASLPPESVTLEQNGKEKREPGVVDTEKAAKRSKVGSTLAHLGDEDED